jgi:hypothetical protein
VVQADNTPFSIIFYLHKPCFKRLVVILLIPRQEVFELGHNKLHLSDDRIFLTSQKTSWINEQLIVNGIFSYRSIDVCDAVPRSLCRSTEILINILH